MSGSRVPIADGVVDHAMPASGLPHPQELSGIRAE